MIAAEESKPVLVKELLSCKGIKLNEKNSDGNTALMIAIEETNFDIAKLLINAGVDCNIQNKGGDTALTIACSLLDEENGNAAEEIISMLLKSKSNPNLYSELLSSPIAIALDKNNEIIFKELIKNGANLNSMETENGWSVMMLAAIEEKYNFINHLIDAGADGNLKDKKNNNILMYIIKDGNEKLVSRVLAKGADPNIVTSDDTTPLSYAIQCKSPKILKLLLDAGAKVNTKNKRGVTPLYLAVSGNASPEYIEMLLAKGADVNIADKDGMTPLMLTVCNKEEKDKDTYEIVKLLIENGSDLKLKSKENKTAKDYATEADRTESLKLLK